MFTELDSGIQYYLGAGIKTPWVFDRKNYYIGAINSSYGTYKFISPTCTINISLIRATTSTSTTSTSTSTSTTAAPTSTSTSTSTTAAPTSTSTTTAEPTTTSTTTVAPTSTSTTTAAPTSTSTTTAAPTTTSTTSTTTAEPTTTSTTTAAPIAINGYYNSEPDALNLCNNIGNTAVTVYISGTNVGINDFSMVYSSTINIYTNSSLANKSQSGTYSDINGGGGANYFQWSGTTWTGTGTCPP